MRLGEISFCGHIGFNIKSDELKKRILDEIDLNFKKKIIQKHHEPFNDSMINTLNSNPFLMALRSNGNPYFLYLTKYNNVNQCIFIDKKMCICTQSHLPKILFLVVLIAFCTY